MGNIFCAGEMALTKFLLLMVTLTNVYGLPNPIVNFHVVANVASNASVSFDIEEVKIYIGGANDDYELGHILDDTKQIIEGPDGSEEMKEEKSPEESEEAEEPEEAE